MDLAAQKSNGKDTQNLRHMMARKAYKDLTVADFIGMTPDQIRDVLESCKEEEEEESYQQMKLNESVANFFSL